MQRDDDYSENSIADIISRVAVRVIVVTLLVFVCYAAAHEGFKLGYTIFCAETVAEAPGTDTEITVADGEGIDELAETLSEENVIKSGLAFRVQARLYKLKLYPGTYRLNNSMSVKEIIKALSMTEQEYNDSVAADSTTETDDEGFIGGGDEGSDASDDNQTAAATAGADADAAESGAKQ